MRTALIFAFAALSLNANAATDFDLGTLVISSISSEGSFRAAVVLRGAQTPFFRIDCIDRADPEGKRANNTILVINSSKKIGERNHQIFTGVQDFYCQGISGNLFAGLQAGDKVEVSLKADFTKDDFRGGTEIANISLINVVVNDEKALKRPGVEKTRSYDLNKVGQTTGFFTSREMLQ